MVRHLELKGTKETRAYITFEIGDGVHEWHQVWITTSPDDIFHEVSECNAYFSEELYQHAIEARYEEIASECMRWGCS